MVWSFVAFALSLIPALLGAGGELLLLLGATCGSIQRIKMEILLEKAVNLMVSNGGRWTTIGGHSANREYAVRGMV